MDLNTGRVGKRRVVRLGIEHADQDPGMFAEIVAVAPHKPNGRAWKIAMGSQFFLPLTQQNNGGDNNCNAEGRTFPCCSRWVMARAGIVFPAPVGGKSERMSRSMRGPRWKLLRPFLIPQLFLGGGDQFVRLEAELFLELLERRRGSEGLHADDPPRLTDVALPSQGGGLLHGDASFHFGRQHAVPVFARLM